MFPNFHTPSSWFKFLTVTVTAGSFFTSQLLWSCRNILWASWRHQPLIWWQKSQNIIFSPLFSVGKLHSRILKLEVWEISRIVQQFPLSILDGCHLLKLQHSSEMDTTNPHQVLTGILVAKQRCRKGEHIAITILLIYFAGCPSTSPSVTTNRSLIKAIPSLSSWLKSDLRQPC